MVVWSSDAGQFMVDCKVVVVGACNTGQFLVGYTKVVVYASNANASTVVLRLEGLVLYCRSRSKRWHEENKKVHCARQTL